MMSQNYRNEYRTPNVDKFHGLCEPCAATKRKRIGLGNVGEIHWLGRDEDFEESSLQILTRRQNELLRRNPAGPVTKGQISIAWQG